MKIVSSKYWTLLYVCWIAAILLLSLAPNPPRTDLYLFSWDKFQHAVAYGVMAVLGAFSFRGRFSKRSAGILSVSIAIALGGIVEILQGMTSARSADWLDFLADATGALVLCIPFLRRKESKGTPEP